MKPFVFSLLSLFLVTCAPQQKKEKVSDELEFDFRESKWGDSMTKVMKSESRKPISRKADEITYDSIQLGKYMVELTYMFSKDSLFLAHYDYYSNNVVSPLDVDFANKEFEKTLVEKYGKQISTESDDQLTTQVWKTKKTEITKNLIKSNTGEHFLIISYESQEISQQKLNMEKRADSLNRQKMAKEL